MTAAASPSTANQGFFWREVDVPYYVLRALSALGLVWDLRTPPRHVRLAHVEGANAARVALRDTG